MHLAFFSTDSYSSFKEAREAGALYHVPTPEGMLPVPSNLEALAYSCKAAIECVNGSVPVKAVIIREAEEVRDMFERGTSIEKCIAIFNDCVDEDMTDEEIRNYLR